MIYVGLILVVLVVGGIIVKISIDFFKDWRRDFEDDESDQQE